VILAETALIKANEELDRTNKLLQNQIVKHKSVEATLCELNEFFESLVVERTADIKTARKDLESLIDKRRQAQTALIEKEMEHQLLAAKMTEIVWTLDINLRTVYVSPSIEKVLGFSPEERMVQNLQEQLTPPSMSIMQEILEKMLAMKQNGCVDTERAVALEVEYYHKDGYTLWMENIISGMRNEEGELIEFHGVSRNINKRRQMEQALRESETLLKSYLENAPDGIYQIDPEGNLLYGNRKCEEIIGYRRGELIGKNFMELNILSEKSLNRAVELLQYSREGKPTGPDEIELIGKGGHLIPVEINTSVVQHKDQKIIVGFVRNIADRKEAEVELRESERKYRELFNFLPLPLFEMDTDGNIKSGNPAMFEAFGYTQGDFEKGVKAIQVVIPEQLERVKLNITKVLNGEKEDRSEYVGLRKNGSTFPFVVFPYPIIHGGRITGVRGAIFDLTERKRIEESLKKSNLSLAEAQRIAHIGNWEWNIESAEIYLSDELQRITGIEHQIYNGTFDALYENIFPDDKEIITNVIDKAMFEGEKSDTGHRIIHHDGSVRYVRHQVEPIMNDTSRIVRVIGIVQDITEKIQMEKDLQSARDQLNQSEKLASLGRLSTGVAHEILNPVNIISMELQVLRTMENLSSEVLQELNICMAQIDRIVSITENLKQFSRIPEKKTLMADINVIIDQVLALYATQLKIEEIETEIQYEPDLPLISMDKEKMEQVVMNLITNATNAMKGKETKVLHITTERGNMFGDNDHLRIMIADTGTGIRNEYMSKIFDPFFTTRGQGEGTGLGLSISYGIINDHGGKIWAENNERGGASFYISLPIQMDVEKFTA
jgi:PAS domain S-box-containing protein